MAAPKRRKPAPKQEVNKNRINTEIRTENVRLIDEDGTQLGVMTTEDGLALAAEKGLDLVEVSGKSDPPVCRIMDYGKFKYQESKKAHEAKKKQVVIKVKEIKMRPKTEEHDFQFKLKHTRTFLQEGNKVKVTVQFRGREMAYTNLGIDLLQRMAEATSDLGQVEATPRAEGRTAQMILAPIKK